MGRIHAPLLPLLEDTKEAGGGWWLLKGTADPERACPLLGQSPKSRVHGGAGRREMVDTSWASLHIGQAVVLIPSNCLSRGPTSVILIPVPCC